MYIKTYEKLGQPQVILRSGIAGYFSDASVNYPVAEIGQMLWKKFPAGVIVAIYDSKDPELTRRAIEWAEKQDTIGIRARKIDPAELRFGKAIADSGNIVKQLNQLGTALKASVDAVQAPQGITPSPGTSPHLIRTLALFTHGTNTWLGIGGDIVTRNVATVIKGLAPILSIDVNVVIYGCSAGRGQTERSNWEMTTMEAGGEDSLAAKIRDALIKEGKSASSVWSHTEVGHTTRNPSLRIFVAAFGKGTKGRSYAGEFIFGTVEKVIALRELEDSISPLGYTIGDNKQENFRKIAYRELRKLMYRAYIKANIKTITKGGNTVTVNNLTYRQTNLAEMAPLYPLEVADVIRKYWSESYWSKNLKENIAKTLITKLKLTKS